MKTSKLTFITVIFSIIFSLQLNAQDNKTIQVTGSAEMFIQPDEFIFIIGIEEYWEEEFEKGSEFKDYKNKVDISKIEGPLLQDLMKLGIKKQDIKSTEVGNYWRYSGKDFLISKKLEISLTDFNMINKIISNLNRRGIDYMRIGELKHKDLVDFRKEVKIKAIIAAKEKATYLLEALGEELGEVISIVEADSSFNAWRPQNRTSNVMMESDSSAPTAEIEKKIKLRFEINAIFKIK
jgi:uncharacterized protein YggE